MRSLDPQAKALIQSFESCRLTAYQDQGGIWTIGWGHTGPEVKAGQTITQQQADDLFVHDTAIACQDVEDLVTVKLTDNQFGALVSLDYNIGRTAFANSTLLRLLNAGDYASVPTQLARWNKIGKEESAGLTRRRSDESRLWLTPDTIEPILPQSVTPTAPLQTPLYKTKTIIGGITAFIGSLLDKLTGVDFNSAASQVNSFADLGHSVKYLAFFLTALGFGLVIYGRMKVRKDSGA